jgi:transcriptional regulator with XRE-family HTH domain
LLHEELGLARRSSGPTVVRRRLGRALRELREDANIRIERAARELECSTAKISRLENGLGPAKLVEVRALLDLYGLDDPARRAQFEKWTGGTKSSGWWEADSDLTDNDWERMLAIETESVALRTYCTPVFPALLQTRAYALAHSQVWVPGLSADDAERFVGLRLARQAALLDRGTDLRLDAVIDEGAVRRQVGSPEIHADQLTWLADLLDRLAVERRDDVSVRILPFAAGVPAQAMSAFMLFTPRDADFDPVVALVEGTDGNHWYDTADEVAHLEAVFGQLKSLSLTPHASLELLRRL